MSQSILKIKWKSLGRSEKMSLEAKIKFASMNIEKRKMTGAEIAALTLMYIDLQINGNLRTPYFGVHGGAILDLNDAWAKANLVINTFNNGEPNPLPDDNFSLTLVDILTYLGREYELLLNPLNVVYSRKEEIGGFAAIGYAKAVRNGNVGVMFGTSGPGQTEQLTNIGEAWADSIPLMALWGQVPTTGKGRGFQQGYGLEMAKPSAKYAASIQKAGQVAEEIIKAHYLARTGRPGAVAVEVPKDVQQAELEFDIGSFDELFSRKYEIPIKEGLVIKAATLKSNYVSNLDSAVEVLSKAERPFILVGGGVVNSGAEAARNLYLLAKKTNFPLGSTLMGLGAYPLDDEQFLGMVGMHGLYTATMALYGSDAVLGLARLDDRVIGNVAEFMQNGKKVVQVDIDPEELGRRMDVIPILGDMRDVLDYLAKNVKPNGRYENWWNQINEWKKQHPLNYDRDRKNTILPQYLVETSMDIIPPGSIISTGVGAFQMWAAQYVKNLELYLWLTSGGFGTMGHGLPALIGASFAHSGKQLWDMDGDGSFEMTEQALGVVDEYQIPAKIVIAANNGYGIVRQWQKKHYAGRTNGSDFAPPDFAKMAEAYRIEGITVTHKGNVRKALEYMRDKKGPILGQFIVDPNETLVPWVLSGKSPYSKEGMILEQLT